MNKKITVIAQAFYGNKTKTEINLEKLDHFILGYLDDSIGVTEPIDRTIIKIPNTNNIVLVYNKYQEEELSHKVKPLAVIPESNIKIYSRCIVCRMNKNGELDSLEYEDLDKFMMYLAD